MAIVPRVGVSSDRSLSQGSAENVNFSETTDGTVSWQGKALNFQTIPPVS